MNEFHLSFTLMVFSIRHKTILPQQMHSAAHIMIIRHLNNIHVLARHAVPNVCSCIFTHPGRKALFKITYTLIYYTLKMHLYAVFLPLTHSSPSPAFSHVGGRTGHPAMPHQYAWWNVSPAFPHAAVAEAYNSGNSGQWHRIWQVMLAGS